ncbi:endonuclease/exonuclease/phosphatase family protein [soil metagenome]
MLVLLWLLLGIAGMNVSPQWSWVFGFLAFSTPVPLLLNLLFLLYWLARRSWMVVLPLLVVGGGWDYYHRGLSLNLADNRVPEQAARLEVLSFNVEVFNSYAHQHDSTYSSSINLINWVAQHPADVLLLQEFYHEPGSEVYATKNKIGEEQGRELFVSPSLVNRVQAEFGLAIFSRYPILSHGQIPFGKLTFNHAIYADLQVNADTIRVYNTHLESMAIDGAGVVAAVKGERVRSQGKDAFKRLRKGFLARGEQVNLLLDHMASSPYPVLVGGDLNDIPWSYTYEQFNHRLTNAFQASGRGFGFTYNGKIPFLRIDNQFYSEGLRAHRITVHREMPYSDHFPVSVEYSISYE